VDAVTASAVSAIDWYRREISPHKGFSCAYRVKWGGRSCAGVVRGALVSEGLFSGVRAAFRQPLKCYAASRLLAEQSEPEKKEGEQDARKENGMAQYAAAEGAWWCCFLPFFTS
jgi:putative component of membrane protein insertase Oxa1/YidC/SpoIIIJ protein YidD